AELGVLPVPVAERADAAGIERAVGAPLEAIDTGFKTLGEAEDCALPLAVDVFEEDAPNAAAGEFTHEHLAGKEALRDELRLGWGVADFVLREIDRRGRAEPVGEIAGVAALGE